MNISKFTQKSLQAVQDLEKTAFDEVMTVFAPLLSLEQELDEEAMRRAAVVTEAGAPRSELPRPMTKEI